MMASARDYINAASQYIGVSGTDNIFNTWIWGRHVYEPNTYPWCAAFQSYVGVHDLGMPFNPSASAAGVAWQGTQVDASEAQLGDWVLFNWDGRGDFGWADHIGLVEWFDHGSGYFGTIEGNTGGGEGCVMRCTRSIYNGYATAFFRPPYDESEDDEMGIYDVHESAAAEIGGVAGSMIDRVDWIDARVSKLAEPHDSATGDGTTGSVIERVDYIDQRVREMEPKVDAIRKQLTTIEKLLKKAAR